MGGRSFFKNGWQFTIFHYLRDSDDVRILFIHSARWSRWVTNEKEEAQKGILKMVLGVACGPEYGDEVLAYILWRLGCRPHSPVEQKRKSPQPRSQYKTPTALSAHVKVCHRAVELVSKGDTCVSLDGIFFVEERELNV